MSRQRSAVIAVAALLVTVGFTGLAEAQGQRGRGGRGFFSPGMSRVMLLSNDKVQAELELVDDQKTQLDAIQTELRDSFGRGGGQGGQGQDLSDEERRQRREEAQKRMEAVVAKVEQVLLPHQLERLKQINLQVAGTRALNDDEVATALEVTEAQKEQIETINRENFEQIRALFPGRGQGGQGNQGGQQDFEAARAKMEELRKATDEKLMAVLTDDQRQKFEELKGEPMEGVEELRQGFGGRGGPGRGGRGGRGRGARPEQGTE